VSNPSGVQPVHCPVIWLPRPDAAVRPAGVQPVRRPAGWCPPGWCPSPSGVQPAGVHPSTLSHPSRPASASGSDGGHPVRRGNGHDWIEFHVVRPVLGGSVDGPMRHSCGHRCGGHVEAGGGASAGAPGPGGASAGGCGRPTRRPDRREGRPSVATSLGQGPADAMLPHGTVWSGHLAWSRDYAAWSVRSLMSEWTGVEGPNELGGQDGARPQRGPGEVAGTPARRRQRRDLREWWWARQGLNL
jgi:hypothetical protein